MLECRSQITAGTHLWKIFQSFRSYTLHCHEIKYVLLSSYIHNASIHTSDASLELGAGGTSAPTELLYSEKRTEREINTRIWNPNEGFVHYTWNDTFNALVIRGVVPGNAGADFGRSVNPVNQEGQSMPTTLLLALQIFRPSYGPANTINRAVSSDKQPSKEALCLLVEGTTNSAVICFFVQNSPHNVSRILRAADFS